MSHAKTEGIPAGWKADNGMHVITDWNDPAMAAFIAYDRLVVELFAGPGGFSEGERMAGLNPRGSLGFEWDASACMTAVSAGHPRFHGDVWDIDPRRLGFIWGFHSSPPCQGFSPAGKGEGRHDMLLLINACHALARGMDPDEVMRILRANVNDAKSPLALLPLVWALIVRPRWITMEQVATVQPLWDVVAETLRAQGYSVWTGTESSEKFGVGQTRKRALVVASLDRDVSGGLIQTHSRFFTTKAKRGQLEPGFLPYVTMAQALGWGMTERPSMTVTGGGTNTGGAEPFGNGGRQGMERERSEGRWKVVSNYGTNGDPEARGERFDDEPAATVTSKGGRNKVVEVVGARVHNSDPVPQFRTGDEPAFTVTGTGRHPGFEFVATHMGDVRNSHGAVRAVDEPAATVTSSADNGNFMWVNRAAVIDEVTPRVNNQSGEEFDLAWPADQPAPAVAGRGLVGMPGANANRFNGSKKSRNDGVRITVQEGGILQSFPADYPWQGTLTKKWEQVGNAVPPLLGKAMIELALGLGIYADAA